MGGKTPTACSTTSTSVVTVMMTTTPATTAKMDFVFMTLARDSVPFVQDINQLPGKRRRKTPSSARYRLIQDRYGAEPRAFSINARWVGICLRADPLKLVRSLAMI